MLIKGHVIYRIGSELGNDWLFSLTLTSLSTNSILECEVGVFFYIWHYPIQFELSRVKNTSYRDLVKVTESWRCQRKEQIMQEKEEQIDDSICGFLHNVSCVRISTRNRSTFFNALLQTTRDKYCRVAVFSVDK